MIPDGDYYDKRLKYRWNGSSNISNAIGQGEVLTTPIQLANYTAAIANRGSFHTPHIVKKIDNTPIDKRKFVSEKTTTIDKKYFEPVIEGMHEENGVKFVELKFVVKQELPKILLLLMVKSYN